MAATILRVDPLHQRFEVVNSMVGERACEIDPGQRFDIEEAFGLFGHAAAAPA